MKQGTLRMSLSLEIISEMTSLCVSTIELEWKFVLSSRPKGIARKFCRDAHWVIPPKSQIYVATFFTETSNLVTDEPLWTYLIIKMPENRFKASKLD